jgi:hypothetical protein
VPDLSLLKGSVHKDGDPVTRGWALAHGIRNHGDMHLPPSSQTRAILLTVSTSGILHVKFM